MESWAKAAESLARVVESTGPWGALIIAATVGVALTLVLVVHVGGLVQSRKADRLSLDFVDRLIAEVDKLSAREVALRAEMERQELDRDSHRLRAVELQADVELMRAQLRRAIEALRAVRDGHLTPAALAEPDLAELLR